MIEPLERRRLASTASLTSRGTLLVLGTKTANKISIDLADAHIIVRQRVGTDPVTFKAIYEALSNVAVKQVKRVYVDTGAGDDRISLGAATFAKPTTLIGGAGDDVIRANAGAQEIFGGAGDDILSGDAGDDLICGDDGNDNIGGGAGNDTIIAGRGADSVNGSDGDDSLRGGAGEDVLDGGFGNDTLRGNEGSDYLLTESSDPQGSGDLYDGGPDHDQAELPATGIRRRLEELVNPPDRE